MHLKHIFAKLATASLLAGTAVVAGTGAASASTTNGEHITVVAPFGSPYTSALLIGTNYQGDRIQTAFFPITRDQGYYDRNWFKGVLQINWYTGNHSYSKTTFCDVPTSKSGSGTYWACGLNDHGFDPGF